MWTISGLFSGFMVLGSLLFAVDQIAIRRGLGGAHPLSPAVAWALLLGVIIWCALSIGGMHLDQIAALNAKGGE